MTFPDPLGLSPEAGEDLLLDLGGGKLATEVINKWLSEKDAAFVTKHLTLRQMLLLMRQASEHYQASLGSLGEGHASTTA